MNPGTQANTQDFFDRFKSFLEAADPIVVLIGLMGMLFLFALALFGRRYSLFAILLVSATFSGAMWAWLDNGSAMVRWLVLALLALNILRLGTSPGLPLLIFMIYVVLGIGMIPFSETFTWSMQTGGLLVLTCLTGVVVSDSVKTKDDLRRVLYIFLLAAFCWLALGVMTLPQLLSAKGERFSGAITSAPLFVITGGLLLPILTWATIRPGRKSLKILFGMMTMLTIALLFVSGQRTGTIAGLLGTLVVLSTLGKRALVVGVIGLGVLLCTGLILSATSKNQLDFVLKRFTSGSNSGRTKIWLNALDENMKSPIIGHGHGGDRAFGVKYQKPMHNAYLSAWYNTGIIGLSFYLAAFATGLWQSFRTFRRSPDPEMRLIAMVMFGLLVAQLFAGFFETLTSPSNFPTIVLMVTFALIGRVTALGAIPERKAAPIWYVDPRTNQRYLYLPGYVPAAKRGL